MSHTAVADRWPLVGRRPELFRFSRVIEENGWSAFVVHGPPGVGKTRLAEECMQLAELAERGCGRAAANPEAATVPLAAIAHLLPADLASTGTGGRAEPLSGLDLFTRAKRAFEERGGGKRFVLMVDDLHLLDVTTAALLRQLLASGTLFLVGTVLSAGRSPTSVTALWRDDRCMRVDLDHLPRDSVETLLHHALGAPVDGPASHTLWSNSTGNVLLLRELVLGAEQSGALVDDGGVWRLARPLASTPRLNELVAERVASVGEPGRRALEVLALCAPLGMDAFAGLADPEALEALEEAGLIRATLDRRRRQLTLVHPVHRSVLREQIPGLRRRGRLLHQAALVEGWGAHRREDPLRIATWRLEATGQADPDLLLHAARLAHDAHDYPLVVKLAGAAQTQRPSATAGAFMGKAFYEIGMFSEADVELSRADRLVQDDDDRVAVTAARVANLVWGLLRPDDALTVNRAAHGASVRPEARQELTMQDAWIHVFAGWPAKASDLIAAQPHVEGLRARVVRAVANSYATTLGGRPNVGLDAATQGQEDDLRLGSQLWLDQPAGLVLAQVLALSEAGRLQEAAESAKAGYQQASQANVPLLQIRFAFHCGRIALLAGRTKTAKRWFREAAARSDATHFAGPRALALSGLAVAEGLVGDAAAAGTAVRAADEVQAFGFLRPERELGRAWSLVAAGDLAGACRVLVEASEVAADTGHITSATWLLHDAARLGHGHEVAPRLEELAEACDSELVRGRTAHARALATSDLEGLERAAVRMEGMGAILVAAEALCAASEVASRLGLARRASASAVRSVALAARCEGARTPGLLAGGGAVALTTREREVAVMAATGLASREIAERLYLSVRTVNNHLQRVYTKLGVGNRDELTAHLDGRDHEGRHDA